MPGPAVVAIGGGHGLSASLRAVRGYAGSITGVVSVADDGGSSGRLRALLPQLPAPGDARRCLGALADPDLPFARILEHRFAEGDLAGHALGNLLLAALADELGSFGAAVDELAERVGAVGRVLPATSVPVSLTGEVGEVVVVGQAAVARTAGLSHVGLLPPDAGSPPAVAAAIAGADQVVLGPGSLFTSVLAALVAPEVRRAVAATGARRVYVANLAPQDPETAGFAVADEVKALADHGVEVDVVVVDPARAPVGDLAAEVVVRPVAAPGGGVHDPARLGGVLAELAGADGGWAPPGPVR